MMSDDRQRPGSHRPDAADLDRRIARALRRARLAAHVETLWRRAVPVAWVAGLHVALAWLGLYAALPPIVATGLFAVVVGLFVLALAAALQPRGEPSDPEAAALARVEAASGLAGHEVAGLLDRPAGVADPATERLWAAHRARLAARIDRLEAGWPQPDLGRRDRWALRPLLGFALFVGWFAAAADHLTPLLGPWTAPATVTVEDRLDVWIDPPAYTGRAPLVLIAEGRPAAPESREPTTVPQGSRLVVRVASPRPDRPPRPLRLTFTPTGAPAAEIAAKAPAEPPAADAPPPTTIEWTTALDRDGEVRLGRDGTPLGVWTLAVQPDRPPTIRLLGAPEIQASGALKLGHETGDDWGVVAAEARFAPAAARPGRPLFAAPNFPLALPLGRAHTGTAATLRDVTAHPFAGSPMRLTLVARDEIGQEGTSPPLDLTLPERPFRKPLARSLAELRRRLALDAGEAATVSTALDALTLAPERFAEKPAVHLGLRFLRQRAAAARDDDALRELVDLLWVAATTLEDGDLAEQEKALRDAQEALRRAIAEGASPDEIARLTRELRAAMEKFLAAKAEQARRSPPRTSERVGPQKLLTERDIARMLDRIEDLARTGSREAAEKLLEQLREMMENLQAGAPSGGEDGQGGAEALEKLGDMIRRQQKLMEETHRSERESGEDDGSAMGRLGDSQNELRDALKQFSDQMRGQGTPKGPGEGGSPRPGDKGSGTQGRSGSGEDGSGDLDDAAEAMGEAGTALGRGEGEAALDAQTRALESLRQGARRLADQMMRRNGRGGRDGQGAEEEDPLGRPRRNRGLGDTDKVRVPDEIDVERARRILDDIRKRLGETARPKLERDYLDRLLKLDR